MDFASGQLGAWGKPLENSDLYAEAFGHGGSRALDCAFQTEERQVEFRMLHARLHHEAIEVSDDPNSSTETIATSAIARHRMPIPDWRVAGGRVR